MHTKTALGPLFAILLLAVTGCEGLLTTEVVNEVPEAANETNHQNCAETIGALRGYVRFEGLEGEASTPGYEEGYSRLFSPRQLLHHSGSNRWTWFNECTGVRTDQDRQGTRHRLARVVSASRSVNAYSHSDNSTHTR